jgi:hypothetical protein
LHKKHALAASKLQTDYWLEDWGEKNNRWPKEVYSAAWEKNKNENLVLRDTAHRIY